MAVGSKAWLPFLVQTQNHTVTANLPRKNRCSSLVRLVEVRGIEPLSENTPTQTSPITVGYLDSPKQARTNTLRFWVASLVLRPLQSLGGAVPRIVDAGTLACGRAKAGGRIKRRKLNYRCCLFFCWHFNAFTAADGYL